VSESLPEKRANKGRIQKGQVLNPGGRPKIPQTVKEMLKAMTPEAVEELAKIMRNPMTKDADRLRAIEQILDRSLGKPVQQVNADVTTLTPILFDPSLAMLVRSDDADDADE